MYIDDSIRRYIDDASSDKPAPGGGSVAALAAAAGLSMACMAANFTVGRKKFKDVEQRVNELLGKCAADRDELLELMDADVQAYSQVSGAYALPREKPEDKALRDEAIQKALRIAMDVPLRSVRACRAALHNIAALADIANPNLISDVGVAAILTEAALRCAKLNVEINLGSLKDQELVARTRQEIDQAASEAREMSRRTVEKVAKAIGGTA